MSLLFESAEQKKMDVRVIERNLRRGVLQHEDVAKAIKNLPDDASNAIWISSEDLFRGGGQKASS